MSRLVHTCAWTRNNNQWINSSLLPLKLKSLDTSEPELMRSSSVPAEASVSESWEPHLTVEWKMEARIPNRLQSNKDCRRQRVWIFAIAGADVGTCNITCKLNQPGYHGHKHLRTHTEMTTIRNQRTYCPWNNRKTSTCYTCRCIWLCK